MSKYLQVAGFLDNSGANGTGLRSVLFVSGCTFHCDDCQNKDFWSLSYGDRISTDEIFKRIKKNSAITDGVTFCGGEPFQSAEALSELATMIKTEGMNLWSYSGYTFEQLLNSNDPHKLNLLGKIDVLIDGLFVKELFDESLYYRGSSNQRIIDVQKSLSLGKVVELTF
jgi:anaerobic ribonucleoside-triphosphate reductase activating protein